MKVLNLLLLGLLFVGGAAAQNPPRSVSADSSSNVTVMKIRWHQVVSVPALYDDPMRINQERDDLERDQKATARANVIRTDQGQTQVPLPSKAPENTSTSSPLGDAPIRTKHTLVRTDPGPSSVKYSYEARIKNQEQRSEDDQDGSLDLLIR